MLAHTRRADGCQLKTTVSAVLDAITLVGSKWVPTGSEGPRRIGHCAYCKGACCGVTANCDLRVWNESPYGLSQYLKLRGQK